MMKMMMMMKDMFPLSSDHVSVIMLHKPAVRRANCSLWIVANSLRSFSGAEEKCLKGSLELEDRQSGEASH